MRKCPDCKNESVIEDGYCGRCRQCTMSPLEQKLTPDKPKEQGDLRSKELLCRIRELEQECQTISLEMEQHGQMIVSVAMDDAMFALKKASGVWNYAIKW